MTEQNPKQSPDWIEDVKTEVTGMAREGLSHPSSKPVLIGAGVGAVAGLILPVVSWPLGLAAGVGIALYQRIRK